MSVLFRDLFDSGERLRLPNCYSRRQSIIRPEDVCSWQVSCGFERFCFGRISSAETATLLKIPQRGCLPLLQLPPHQDDELLAAESKGRYFAHDIRDKFRY